MHCLIIVLLIIVIYKCVQYCKNSMVSGLVSAPFNRMDSSTTLEFTSDDGMYLAINFTPWEASPKDKNLFKEKKNSPKYAVLHDDVKVGRKLNKLVYDWHKLGNEYLSTACRNIKECRKKKEIDLDNIAEKITNIHKVYGSPITKIPTGKSRPDWWCVSYLDGLELYGNTLRGHISATVTIPYNSLYRSTGGMFRAEMEESGGVVLGIDYGGPLKQFTRL